jgi:hypothetical protein
VHSVWWQQPLGMAVLGVALMVGGWMVMSYTPERSGGLLEDMRRWASDQAHEEGASGLRDRLPPREAPYHLPGRFILLAGVVLFVAAGVRMWRQPPEAEQRERTVPDEDVEGEE